MKSHPIIFSMLLIVLAGLIYNVYDNNRYKIVKQEITIDPLPRSFDGFTILQISDLHGSYFGENQANLIKAINSLDYDMIAFTGDMNASTAGDDSVENSKAVLDLLDGIENKEYVFWVDGNTGPYAIESFAGAMTGELTAIGKVLQEKGVKMLILPAAIRRGGDAIWITPEMSEMGFDANYRSGDEARLGGKEKAARIRSFYQEAYAAFQAIKGNGGMKIMLSHYPKQINLSAEELQQTGNVELDYDLIIAGHYHGGQLRLPLIGALYIPSPTTGINNSGLFPAQDAVRGVSYYGDVPQYVSAGLGSSGHVRLARFRLFNTPEINLITLRSLP